MSDGNLWERQPGETAKAYAAFLLYRDLPAIDRSVAAAREGHKKDRKGTVRQWNGWSTRNGWVSRAAEHDSDLASRRRERMAKELDRAKDDAAVLIRAALAKVAERIQGMDAEELAAGQIPSALRTLIELELKGRLRKPGTDICRRANNGLSTHRDSRSSRPGRAYSSSRADRRANTSACTDAHEPTGAYGGFKARAYSNRDADTDGHANPGPGPNRNADTHTRAHGDGYPCARAYSDPNGSTDARAHGGEQPYARINNDGNTYVDTNPEGSHVAGTRCSARGPVLGICLQ